MKRTLRATLASLSRRTPDFRGKLRVTRALGRMLNVGSDTIVTDGWGTNFIVDGRDFIGFWILWHGGYGRDLVNCLHREIRSRNARCFWDVGANIGAVCLPLATSDPSLSVHAFEPSPSVMAKLHVNARANAELSNVRLYAMALSNTTFLVPFFEGNSNECSGLGGLYADSHNREKTPILVQSMPGDRLIQDEVAPRPDVMKIDVEGWELEVLQGMKGVLEDGRPLSIVWEHCIYRIEERGHARDAIASLLQGHGFELFVCRSGGELEPFRPAMLDEDHDFVARRG